MVMPTGSGKSLTVVAAALLTGWRTVVLTSTKGLQSQYMGDFESVGLVDVRGKNAYECVALKDEHEQYNDPTRWQSCEEGPCNVGISCSRKPTIEDPDAEGCYYFDAVRSARTSPLVVTNYKFYLSQTYYGQGLGKIDCLVLDEAHNSPNELADFLSTELTYADIESTLHLRPPADATDLRAWAVWAKREGALVERQLDGWKPRARAEIAKYRKLKAVARKLTIIATVSPENWVVTDAGCYHFDPVWVKDHAEGLLFQGIPKVICTSATWNRKTADMLGVGDDRLEWFEAPSDFPVARRPVYYVPTVKLDFRADASQERLWVARIDQIIRARRDRKGIIHTVSYLRRNKILQLSEFAGEMIAPDSHTTRSCVERFKQAGPGAILISPALTTGYDFPYTECEYQIVTKIPFPDSRSPVVAARTAVDKDYPAYVAMQELVQAVGRGMRAKDDQCETFVIDNNVSWFVPKFRALAPKWFLDSYRTLTMLPEPLEAL